MDEGKLFGRSIAFPPRVGPDGRWAWSAGSDNIRESIQLILLTGEYERVLLPTFGAGLKRFLFEPNTSAVRRLIQERISSALRLWEPRINVQAVAVDEDPEDERRIVVTLEYRLVATQTLERMSLTLELER